MNRVIHFEIHAADPLRAAEFYRRVFGWEIREWTMPGVQLADEHRYWVATTGAPPAPGIDGGILFRRSSPPADGQPVNAYVCTIGVPALDEFVAKATVAGGTLALPKMPIKGIGWLAYCKDTEGNIFGMMQEDTLAGT
jgi:hypothetical protein